MAKAKKFKKTSKAQAKDLGRQIHGISALEGIKYEYSAWILYEFAKRDPVVRAAINSILMSIMAGGWSVEPKLDEADAEAQAKEFMEWSKYSGGTLIASGEQVNLDSVLTRMILSMVIGDEIYIEVRENVLDQPVELHVMDWEDMRVKLADKHGTVGGYIQFVDGKVVATFEPDEIIHRTMFSQGTRKYGMSLIRSIAESVSARRFAQRYADAIFLNQEPKGYWIFDLPQEEYDQLVDQIKEGKTHAWHKIFLRGKPDQIKHEKVEVEKMAYKDFMEANRKEILVGMGVPAGAVFLSGEAKGWESDVEMAESDKYTNFRRTFIESIFNDLLMPRLGFNSIVFKFNRMNKRDEEREAKIAQMVSDVFTINERREMLGKQPIEGGDFIVPSFKAGKFDPETGEAVGGTPTHEEGPEMEGVGVGREMFRFYRDLDTRSKTPDYFKKSHGHNNLLFNKPVSMKKVKKITPKTVQKMQLLENEYINSLNNLLKEYVNKIINVVEGIDQSTFFKDSKLKKIANPDVEIEAIEVLRSEFMARSRDLSKLFVNRAWEFGVDSGHIELGMDLAKINVAQETLDFLEKRNINLVEGAFSELAKSAKFQIGEGIRLGESIPDITKRLETYKGSVEAVYKNRMRTIARTEVSAAMNEGSLAAYTNSKVVDKVQVLIGLDPDGLCSKQFDGSPGNLSKEWDLEGFSGPPVHPNCTCVVVPVVRE